MAETDSKELRFDGQVVIVTGAGNGIGKATSLELGRRGASASSARCAESASTGS